MKDTTKNKVLPILLAILFFGTFLFLLLKPDRMYSESERRVLAKSPKATTDTLLSGSFMSEFEEYALDQFPFRDTFRGIKASFQYTVFQKKDNNGIYLADGQVSKLEYPISEKMLDHAADRFSYLYETYLKEQKIVPYMVIVPDKNFYLAEKNGYLSMDYDELYSSFQEKTPFMKQINVTDLLDETDYYRTDTHWRQERILDVAERICEKLETVAAMGYEEHSVDVPFQGVYVGQSALPLQGEELCYLDNDLLRACQVNVWDSGSPITAEMYNLQKADGADGYELFLEGAKAVISIDNPNADRDRQLVIFRDSFGSSLAPLLVSGYSRITLVDIRYIRSDLVGQYVDFADSDVLFLYSTMLLNSSMALK